MTGSPADLYSELILDHARHPHRRGRLDGATAHADGFNPLCGDRVEVWIDASGGAVRDARFDGVGCAISTASASMMTDAIAGREITEARESIERFLRAATGTDLPGDPALPEDLEALASVRRLPMRVKCATLAWHAAASALDDADRAANKAINPPEPTP